MKIIMEFDMSEIRKTLGFIGQGFVKGYEDIVRKELKKKMKI